MEDGWGLLSIAHGLEAKEQNLSLYINHLEERLMKLSKKDKILPESEGPVSTAKKQKNEDRHKQWK